MSEAFLELCTALAYFTIPISVLRLFSTTSFRLTSLMNEEREASATAWLSTMAGLSAAFVGLCGLTHLSSFVKVALSHDDVADTDDDTAAAAPLLIVAAVAITPYLRAATAVVSCCTAVELWMILPTIVSTYNRIDLIDSSEIQRLMDFLETSKNNTHAMNRTMSELKAQSARVLAQHAQEKLEMMQQHAEALQALCGRQMEQQQETLKRVGTQNSGRNPEIFGMIGIPSSERLTDEIYAEAELAYARGNRAAAAIDDIQL